MIEKMNEELTLDEALLGRLNLAIKTKTGQTAVDEEGRPITATQAIAMSILNNAMKGDIQSALFIRNIASQAGGADADERRRARDEQMQRARDEIRHELETEGLYIGQDLEIEHLATSKILLDRLSAQINDPDYQDVIVTMRRDGTQSQVINPISELYEKRQSKFITDFKQMRNDAMIRKNNMKRR